MKCNDCLEEISDKEYYNKSLEGVCKKCRSKIANLKYYNKVHGTNIEYVPAKMKEKQKNVKTTKTVVQVEKIEPKKEEKRIYSEEIEKRVHKDIEKVLTDNYIDINVQEIPPFDLFINMFESLIELEKGFMGKYKKAEELFNRMECDYQHAYEDAQDPQLFMERSQMFRCLLDQRRAVKNGLARYEKIYPLLEEISKKCPKIMDLTKSVKTDLEAVMKLQGEHSYVARASELISQQEFCIGKKDLSKAGTYHVSIPVMGYYGRASLFAFERDCWAESPEAAIENIKAYLKQKFPNVSYNVRDFKAEKKEEAVCS
jgi:hypothetical protein